MTPSARPRVVITGAQGYLGSRIAAGLSGVAEVIPLVRPGTGRGADRPIVLDDAGALRNLLANLAPDHVIHAAGRVAGDAAELHRDNVALTLNLGEAMLEVAPHAILTILGSAAEYGQPSTEALIAEDHPCEPVSEYGRSKLAATRGLVALAERRGLRVTIVRPFNIIGAPLSPAQVLGAFVARAQAALAGPPPYEIPMGNLNAVRDFVAVDDLQRMTAEIVRQDITGVIVNVCSGMGRRVRDLVDFLNKLSDDRFKIIEDRSTPMKAIAVVGDPSRLVAIVGRYQQAAIEPILAQAWRDAIDSRA